MQDIHIKRYDPPVPEGSDDPWLGSIEPEDRSWVLFVRANRPPQLFVAVAGASRTERRFVPALEAEEYYASHTPAGG